MEENLIKISELIPTTELKSADRIPIEQDGETRSIKGAVLEQKLLDKTDARYIENSQKGAPNGVAALDADSKVPNENLNFGKVEEGNSNVVSGGEVYLKTPTNKDVGIVSYGQNINAIEELIKLDVNNTDIFYQGYINQQGNIVYSSDWVVNKEPILITSGLAKCKWTLSTNACAVVKDKEGNVLQFIKENNNGQQTILYNQDVTFVKGYLYLSCYKIAPNVNFTKQSIYFQEFSKLVTSDVFLQTEEFNPLNTANKLNNWGEYFFDPNHNFIKELSISALTDTGIWGDGYLRKDGTIGVSSNYNYSKKYYLIPSNYNMNIHAFFSGNAVLLFYDKDYKITRFIENTKTSSEFIDEIKTNNNEVYYRISHQNYVSEEKKKLINISTNSHVKIDTNKQDVNFNYIESVKKSHTYSNNYPIVTFISDDFYKQNLEWYKTKLDQYGIKSTFAVVTDWLGASRELGEVCTKQDVINMHLEGHDIAGHTHTHKDRGLATWTLEDANEELKKNSSMLRSFRNDIKARMFIAPFGSRNVNTDKILQQYFDTNFVTTVDTMGNINNSLNQPPINRLLIKRVSFDAGTINKSMLELCKSAVRLAVRDGGWLVFAIHPHYPEYNTEHSVDRKAEFDELIQYIQSFELPIMTAQQAYDIYKNRFEEGNELINPTTYKSIGMNGVEKGNF